MFSGHYLSTHYILFLSWNIHIELLNNRHHAQNHGLCFKYHLICKTYDINWRRIWTCSSYSDILNRLKFMLPTILVKTKTTFLFYFLRGRECQLPPAESLPKCPQRPGLGGAKTYSQELNPPRNERNPITWAISTASQCLH